MQLPSWTDGVLSQVNSWNENACRIDIHSCISTTQKSSATHFYTELITSLNSKYVLLSYEPVASLVQGRPPWVTLFRGVTPEWNYFFLWLNLQRTLDKRHFKVERWECWWDDRKKVIIFQRMMTKKRSLVFVEEKMGLTPLVAAAGDTNLSDTTAVNCHNSGIKGTVNKLYLLIMLFLSTACWKRFSLQFSLHTPTLYLCLQFITVDKHYTDSTDQSLFIDKIMVTIRIRFSIYILHVSKWRWCTA